MMIYYFTDSENIFSIRHQLKVMGHAVASFFAFVLFLQGGSVFASTPEHHADFRTRKINSGEPYRYVFTSSGISCDVEGGLEKLRPNLKRDDGHFSCPCTTDMGCTMVNPHVDEDTWQLDPKIISVAPKGTNCHNAYSWSEARFNIGRTLVVVGPVANVKKSTTAQGDRVWINLGEKFPKPNRLTLVIWNNSDEEFKLQQPKYIEGKNICVVGKILNYRGSPQMVLRSVSEFRISK